MTKNAELPPGWLQVEFADLFTSPSDDIVDGPFGSNLKATEYVSDGVPIVRLQNVDRNRFIHKNIQCVTTSKAAKLARHTFAPGDILITKLGDPLGKACLAPVSIGKGLLVADVVRARITHDCIDRRFLTYQINSSALIEQFKEQTKGTTRPRVNLTKIRGLKALLCPRAEQTRIIERLEELLTDLDAGVAEIRAAQAKLAQYRQSLLKAAVEGALTADWRARHARRETGAELLARILQGRRARWEARQLTKFKEQGKTPAKGWQDKYPEPEQPDVTDLPPLPEGWAWASAEQLCDFITKGTTPPKSLDGRGPKIVPFVRVTNLTSTGALDFSDRVFVSESTHREFLARSVVYPDDVLMNIVGPPLGQVSRVPFTFPEWNINQAIAIFRPLEGFSSSLMALVLLSSLAQQWLQSRAKTTAGQTNLTLELCRALPVPVPPLDEQSTIEERVAQALESASAITQILDSGLKQTAAQRQNILKAAFSGQLVPQDPSDEPAVCCSIASVASVSCAMQASLRGSPVASRSRHEEGAGRPECSQARVR